MTERVRIFLLCLAVTAVASDNTTKNILDFWDKQYAAFQVANPKEVVLLLGDVGTGKSTLALLLTDAILDVTKDKRHDDVFHIKDINEKIGNVAGTFKTNTPEKFIGRNSNIVYYDCPGFADTRPVEYDITIGYLVEKLLTHAKSFKIVLVVDHSSVQASATRMDFPNLLYKIIKLFRHIDDYKNGIAMVITKVGETFRRVNHQRVEVNDASLVAQIANYLKMLRNTTIQEMSHTKMPSEKREINEEKLKLLNVLLENNGKTINGYDRLAILRQPSKLGLLSNESVIQNEKRNIQKMIRENLEFVGQDKNMEYGLVVSTKSHLYVNDLIQRVIDTELFNDVSSIMSGINQYYKSIFENIKDFLLLNRTFYGSQTLLTGIKSTDTLTFTKELVDKARSKINNSLRNKVYKHIEYIEFLLKIKKQSLRTPHTFTRLIFEATLYIKNQYYTNVDKYARRLLQDTRFSIVKAIYTEIQEYYTKVEEDTTDVYLLPEKLSKAHGDLSKVDLSNLRSLVDTIETSKTTYIFENMSKLESLIRIIEGALEFDWENISFMAKSTVALQGILQGLKESVLWYDYMIVLDSNLPMPTSKTTPSETDIIQRIINECDNASYVDELSFNALSPFVPENEKKITMLKYLPISSLKKEKLKTILSPFVQKPTIVCSEGNVMTVTGSVIRISEVISDVTCFPDARSIEIFASTSIIIDSSVNKTGTNLSMAIMSPAWTVIDSQSIILKGSDGKSKEAPSKHDNDDPTQLDGEAGDPGETGGNFLGIGDVFLNGELLTVSSVGGNGGRGADGGIGADGEDRLWPSATFSNDPIDVLVSCNKHFLLHRFCSMKYCQDQGYKCDEDEDGLNITIYQEVVFGTNGFRRGDGGLGGFGGKAGRIEVIELGTKSRTNDVSHDGSSGKHGQGGEGGGAAVKQIIEIREIIWKYKFGKIPVYTDQSFYKGLDSHSAKNRRYPEPAHNFDHPSKTISKFIKHLIHSHSHRMSQISNFINEKLLNDERVRQLLNQK